MKTIKLITNPSIVRIIAQLAKFFTLGPKTLSAISSNLVDFT